MPTTVTVARDNDGACGPLPLSAAAALPKVELASERAVVATAALLLGPFALLDG